MEQNTFDKIEFDILVHAERSGKTPSVSNINQFRPRVEDIEKCRRWLAGKGVDCYITDFGLACSASPELFESLFSTKVDQSEPSMVKAPWRLVKEPKPPPEIADCIEQITITMPPELFEKPGHGFRD